MRIETREQLIQVIMNAKKEYKEILTLYTAYNNNNYKSVSEEKYLLSDIHIGYPIHSHGEFEHEFLYSHTAFADRNIGHSHNDNWWFTTREEAEEYINLKPSPITIIIDANKIPEWFLYILANKKIEAIKEIRSSIYYQNYMEEPASKQIPSLKSTKDFVEALQNCIMEHGTK